METVEVVIRIPKELYINVLNSWEKIHPKLYKALKNGTVLPKGHGKIVDVDQFYKAFNEYLLKRKSFSFADLETILNVVTPPILKADKEVGNG